MTHTVFWMSVKKGFVLDTGRGSVWTLGGDQCGHWEGVSVDTGRGLSSFKIHYFQNFKFHNFYSFCRWTNLQTSSFNTNPKLVFLNPSNSPRFHKSNQQVFCINLPAYALHNSRTNFPAFHLVPVAQFQYVCS